jgi:DNA-binding transcriptional ArsR family regulator
MASLKELRDANRVRLPEALRLSGGMDRAEIARRTGLSRGAVGLALSQEGWLRRAGLIALNHDEWAVVG